MVNYQQPYYTVTHRIRCTACTRIYQYPVSHTISHGPGVTKTLDLSECDQALTLLEQTAGSARHMICLESAGRTTYNG